MVYNITPGVAAGGGTAAAFAGATTLGYLILSATLLAVGFAVYRFVPKRHRV